MFELRSSWWLNAADVRERVRKGCMDPLMKAGALVEAEAKRSLSKGGGKSLGADHAKGEGGFPKSSTPPAPPFVRSGNLRASISHAKTSAGTVVVGPVAQAWYGRVHEFGARIAVTAKMRGFLAATFGVWVKKSVIIIPKRPFMRPALYACAARFPELFRGCVK